jgi:hypothetical protein
LSHDGGQQVVIPSSGLERLRNIPSLATPFEGKVVKLRKLMAVGVGVMLGA